MNDNAEIRAAEDRGMRKTFTMGEVQVLLPVLESLLLRAQSSGLRAGELGGAIEELRQHIFLAGGMHVDVGAVARQRAEQSAAIDETKATVAEIEQIGVHVHDLGEGLLDLPFRAEAGEVMLCWRLGEPSVAHWHGTGHGTEEPGERRPLSDLFPDVHGKGDTGRLN